MKQYIQLYESWQRSQTITLNSLVNGKIILHVQHGTIRSIDNRTQLTPDFTTGQPLQLPFIKGWANRHGFKVEDSNYSGEDRKIFGIKTKHIPQGDPLRRFYPGKFRD